MRKSHLVLLIIAAVMSLSSAYSLAAINQVYNINYEWFSQYNSKYTAEMRDTSRDKVQMEEYSEDMNFYVIGSSINVMDVPNEDFKNIIEMGTDFNKYILLYCTLGKRNSPEYRIKVEDIAQRGNSIEVRVSINSPAKVQEQVEEAADTYYPSDLIRIDRDSFPIKGYLWFVFKDQHGNQLSERYYEVDR